jgi:hypothetical protein
MGYKTGHRTYFEVFHQELMGDREEGRCWYGVPGAELLLRVQDDGRRTDTKSL